MRQDWMPDSATGPPTPFGINLAGGAMAMVGAAAIAACLVPAGPAEWRLVVVGLAVTGYTAMVDDPLASLATAGLGYLLFNGFLVNRAGELTWTGTTSVWPLAAFAMALGLGVGWRLMARIRSRAALSAELDEFIDILTDKKDSHHG